MSAADKKASAKAREVITPEFRLSFPNLFKAVAAEEGEEKKFSACLVFDKDADLTALKKAAIFAMREKFGDKADDGIRSGKLNLPWRDDPDDVAEKGYAVGSTFMNVRTNNKPQVVLNVKDPETGRPQHLTDESDIYPGCYCRASIVAFGYSVKGNRGVSFALNNVQKLRDGDRLDSRTNAEDEFDAAMDAEPADLDDLLG